MYQYLFDNVVLDPGLLKSYTYINWDNRYLVCYEDYIVRITFYWTPEEDQLRIAGEKLADFKEWVSR